MEPQRPLDVLISGGGIAGATLACLLGAARHKVTIVERDQGVRSSGNPVDVRGPALGVVDRLGLVPRLRDLATNVRELVIVDAAGRPVAGMATRRRQDRELEVPRADLSAALIDAASRAADIRFDDTIVRLDADERGVDVSFDRAPPERFDLVVGADGLHSAVRRLTFGPEASFVRHLGMYVATVPLTQAAAHDDAVVMYNEPGNAVAVHPGAGSSGVVAFMFRASDQVDPRDRSAAKRLVARVYGEAGWRSKELLASYLAASDSYFDSVSSVKLPTWSHGRVTLLGDAASCVTLFGEGSSSAIAGAATLAESLTQDAHNIPAALVRYEEGHRPVSRRGQRAVPVVSHLLIPSSRAGISIRNQLLRTTNRRRPRAAAARHHA